MLSVLSVISVISATIRYYLIIHNLGKPSTIQPDYWGPAMLAMVMVGLVFTMG